MASEKALLSMLLHAWLMSKKQLQSIRLNKKILYCISGLVERILILPLHICLHPICFYAPGINVVAYDSVCANPHNFSILCCDDIAQHKNYPARVGKRSCFGF